MEDVSFHVASMRPAQLTPENKAVSAKHRPLPPCFNEAGAINAGKLCSDNASRRSAGRFNEAGAINAGKQPPTKPRRRRRPSFNEAGAINAGKLPEPILRRMRVDAASMRPAQLTPENGTDARSARPKFAPLQ